MKVLALNGSPRKGNTLFALRVIGETLQQEGIDYEIVEIGNKRIHGCLGCDTCFDRQNEQCIIQNDPLNEILQQMKQADGLILASPVYYAGISGTMKCFLDRAFYVGAANGGWFRHKVGASVVSLRRSGGSLTFNNLNHYLNISEMLIPTSNYWNIIHGADPGEAEQDLEGIQIMQMLAKNMAWLLQMVQGTRSSIEPPAQVDKIMTNFIR